MSTSPLEAAIRAVGSQKRLADLLKIKSPSISQWRDRGQVPADRCLAIETATAGAVTRYELRPDVFGPAPAEQQQGAA